MDWWFRRLATAADLVRLEKLIPPVEAEGDVCPAGRKSGGEKRKGPVPALSQSGK